MGFTLILSLTQFPLLFHRHGSDVAALRSATTLHLFTALFALKEKKVAVVIGAIYMRIAKRAALMALADDFITDTLTHAVVENKILSDEA